MDALIEQFKKGYKTTEFWLTILTFALMAVNGLTKLDLDVEGIVAIVGTNVSYVLSRSYLKAKRVDAVQVQAETQLVLEGDGPPPVG